MTVCSKVQPNVNTNTNTNTRKHVYVEKGGLYTAIEGNRQLSLFLEASKRFPEAHCSCERSDV